MFLDFLILGIGALGRAVKDEQNRIIGENILEQRAKKNIWQQAKESGSMVTINGHTHMFLTPREIFMNEKFWNSELSLEDFLVKFYIENKGFPVGFMRLIDRNGIAHQISSIFVSDLYDKYKKNKKV